MFNNPSHSESFGETVEYYFGKKVNLFLGWNFEKIIS